MTLSVIKAEGAAKVTEVQDVLYAMRVLTSLGLKVKTPMKIDTDNTGSMQLANSWSVGGRTCHVDVRMHFLRELKDQGLLSIEFVPGVDNETDILTKNTPPAIYNKHIVKFVGKDEYLGEGSTTD